MLPLTQPWQSPSGGGLYESPQGILDPKSMMLMQMGMGLMRGPSTTPISLGQSLGQAGMQGLQAFQQAQQANQQQQLFNMKLAEAKREEDERAQKKAALAELMKDPRFANMGPLLQVAPQQAIERAFPKDNKPMVVAPGASLVDPENPQKPLFTAPDKPKGPSSDLGKLYDDLKNGLITQADYDAKVRKLTTHAPAPSATNIVKQEGEFQKSVGKELGDMYSGLLRADMNAPATISKYQRLGSLLSQVNTGKFTGTTIELKAAAKGLGVDLTALGVADNVAPAQAAKALSNQLALELRNPAGGAGMPGAMSDQDRNFLVQMIPSLENDPKGNEKMLDYRVRLAKREQQVGKMAREYRKKHGKFDEGFFDELQDWSAKNPLFPEAANQATKGDWSIRPK
jgi:hypothetical protein